MRSIDDVRAVKQLVQAGLSTAEICRLTGIPWSTVRAWRTGRTRRDSSDDVCERCGRTCLPLHVNSQAAYAYLLGQYLGDGSIFEHRRRVHRLVIYGDAAIHSDGCRSINSVRTRGKLYRYPRYQFANKSEDIKRIFCEHLDLLGIPWRRMNAMTISISRREAVARLDEFVGPKR